MSATSTRAIDLRADPESLDRFRVAIARITRRLRASGDGNEITLSQRSMLGTIAYFGPLSVGQIAEREHVRPPTASKVVAGLEQLGYVRRSSDPKDRRCSVIEVTEEGRDAVHAMRAAGLGFLAGRLAELDASDVADLERALPALERLVGETA